MQSRLRESVKNRRSAYEVIELANANSAVLLDTPCGRSSGGGKALLSGKKLIFLINFSAGGPTDIEGRIVARHLARHIPGNPLIIVQNMAGAGGVTGINFLGEKAKPDALTLGYFTGPYNHHMMKSTTLRIDLMKVPFIAAVQGVTVCYIRSDTSRRASRNRRTSLKRSVSSAGGLSFDSNKDLRFRLAFDILGSQVRLRYRLQQQQRRAACGAAQRDSISRRKYSRLSRRGRAAIGQRPAWLRRSIITMSSDPTAPWQRVRTIRN